MSMNAAKIKYAINLAGSVASLTGISLLWLYSAFVDGKRDAPKSLLPEIHRFYFEPQYPEFSARTMWSLSNAFTSAFKRLDPVPQFKATAKLGGFLAQLPA